MKLLNYLLNNIKTLSGINWGVLLVSILFFHSTHNIFNVYQYKFIGAICELLWIPSLLAIVFCPIIAICLLIKEKLPINIFNVFTILIAILFLFFTKW
jgi:hypothetical protein